MERDRKLTLNQRVSDGSMPKKKKSKQIDYKDVHQLITHYKK